VAGEASPRWRRCIRRGRQPLWSGRL